MTEMRHYEHVGEAIQQINKMLRDNPKLDIFHESIGAHLNPGDVYDAYEALRRTPVAKNVLSEDECGPFGAVYLHQNPDAPLEGWPSFVKESFDPEYVIGFMDGFQLWFPNPVGDESRHYWRGVYDGVMANAAVF